MDFPNWFKPRHDVPGILCTSQEELDALIEMGWPDKQCPPDGVFAEPEAEPAPVKRGPGRPRKSE